MSVVRSLWVVWQTPINKLFYHIGTLSYFNNHYEFSYMKSSNETMKLNDALSNGYMLHPAFPYRDKVYKSDSLFVAFNRRLPSESREDFTDILYDLGLGESCTKMDLLEATRGRLANDTYSFERPLRVEGDGKLHTSFYIHGMYYSNLPSTWPNMIFVGAKLNLKMETTAPGNPYEVGLYTQDNMFFGYVPGFYSIAVSSLLKEGIKPYVEVSYINEKSTPHWWVKVNYSSAIGNGNVSNDLKTASEITQHA